MDPSIIKNYPVKERYKCLVFLAALGMVFSVLPSAWSYVVLTPIGIVSAGVLISPLWFVLSDIITEIYGLKLAIKLFLMVLPCHLFLGFLLYFAIHFPSPSFGNDNNAYSLIVSYIMHSSYISFIAYILAWLMNGYLLSRWKVLTRGKYFWMRSVGSSGIAELCFSILMTFTWKIFDVYHNYYYSMSVLVLLCFHACLVRIFLTTLLAIPASFAIKIIKIIEQRDHNPSISHGKFKLMDEVR